jgi:hypothetical protein
MAGRCVQLIKIYIIPNKLTELNSIEVREGWKKYYLIILFVWFAIIGVAFLIPEQRKGSIDFFLSKWSFSKLPVILVFTAWPSFCLFYLFDKRVKVRIDKNGIWSLKSGNVSWEDIWYFYSTVYKMRNDGDLFKLHIRLKDTEKLLDKEIDLKLHRMDKNFEDIRAVVEYYAAKYKIEDLGHDNEI